MSGVEGRLAVASATSGGAVVLSAAAGRADGVAATEHTVFSTASISKTFLAALALQCVERGELDLDHDVSGLIGIDVGNPHFPAAAVTSRQLLQHRSSLCDDESALARGSAFRWAAGASSEVVVGLRDYVAQRLSAGSEPELWNRGAGPGDAPYHYSNAGFTLLGYVIQVVAGADSLAELAQRRLFQPIGMHSTAYFMEELLGRQDGQLQFAVPEGQGLYEVAEWPAAQVRSTAHDLCQWLLFLSGAQPAGSAATAAARAVGGPPNPGSDSGSGRGVHEPDDRGVLSAESAEVGAHPLPGRYACVSI